MCTGCALGVLWVCTGCALGVLWVCTVRPLLCTQAGGLFHREAPRQAQLARRASLARRGTLLLARFRQAVPAPSVTGQVASPGPSPYPCAAASLGARSHTRLRRARGSYDGNLEEDLCLTFSVDEEAFGQRTAVELRPGGRVTAVTKENRIEYIHLMADYRLNRQLATQNPNPSP